MQFNPTEPYFVLNEEINSRSLEDSYLNSSSEDNGGDKMASSYLSTPTKAVPTARDIEEDKKEHSHIGGDGFYSWAKSRSGPLEQLLKSYISTHYGMSSTDTIADNTSIPANELSDRDGSNSDDCDSEKLIDSVSQSLMTEDSLSQSERADSGMAQRFSDSLTQRAYEKMLLLDDRLMKAVKREREVKRQRRKLHQKMQEEGITLALGSNLSGTDG